MHRTHRSRWQHSHDFAADFSIAERRTRIVAVITGVMMVVEIAAGAVFNSMALLADGWHMGTHLAAFLIAALAYYFSRRHANDPRYSFGTGKMGVLGGFASAVVLAVVALLMAGESLHRILAPVPIRFNEAIPIAALGLLVNLVCALLLKDSHHHHHDARHHHGHAGYEHGHQDLNLRAAYIHVLADALTSVTAIIALLTGKFLGWTRLDPVMGIAGSILVAVWAWGLLRSTSGILLDRTPETSDLPDEIRRAVEADDDSLVTDLHIWQVASGKFAAIVGIVAHTPKTPGHYRNLLGEHEELLHITIEVQQCEDAGAPRTPDAVA